MSTFLGRRAQAFIKFSKEFVDLTCRTTGMKDAAQSWFFGGLTLGPRVIRVGLHDFCNLFQLLLHTVQPFVGQNISRAGGSLTFTVYWGLPRDCLGAIRMSACLVIGFAANKTLRQAGGLCSLSGYNLFSSVTLTAAKCKKKFESECCCL